MSRALDFSHGLAYGEMINGLKQRGEQNRAQKTQNQLHDLIAEVIMERNRTIQNLQARLQEAERLRELYDLEFAKKNEELQATREGYEKELEEVTLRWSEKWSQTNLERSAHKLLVQLLAYEAELVELGPENQRRLSAGLGQGVKLRHEFRDYIMDIDRKSFANEISSADALALIFEKFESIHGKGSVQRARDGLTGVKPEHKAAASPE